LCLLSGRSVVRIHSGAFFLQTMPKGRVSLPVAVRRSRREGRPKVVVLPLLLSRPLFSSFINATKNVYSIVATALGLRSGSHHRNWKACPPRKVDCPESRQIHARILAEVALTPKTRESPRATRALDQFARTEDCTFMRFGVLLRSVRTVSGH
jgi:hypothetical protein